MTAAAPAVLDVNSLDLYQQLAHQMNDHPDRYRVLGDADMTAVITIVGPTATTNVQLVFEALSCESVDTISVEEAHLADFRLEGPLEAWTAMFNDILANGHASGPWTINSLTLRGDQISCEGNDPMGLDKFSRFNQTLQEFFDGASRLDYTRSIS